ncbi:unnamed protein product [Adineta steineri]|uniref:Uncharacterized protein n=1 Tax=Adineta steineri TaxID=433720 RepID=A0A814V6J0_9BILA|nr:unnamed protein product [Adineta steineri]CAF1415447.1 unnamed protein product [Adineta steineri]
MARREDHLRRHHHHRQIHYASILPVTTNNDNYHEPYIARKPSGQDRERALYIEFENAFQEQTTTNQDYFGVQTSEQNSHPSTNIPNQTVETISEIENRNLVPHIRYQASRETSHSSDTPPYQPRYNHHPNPSRPHKHLSNENSRENLNQDFMNLTLLHSNDNKDIPTSFTNDAIRSKAKQQQQQQQEIIPNSSIQTKIILPQYFLVKYLGRVPCPQLWGAKAVRTPVDDMVRAARHLSSMNEIPTLEACVNTRGFTLTHRHSPTRTKHHHSRNHSPERSQQGLIPLENISYVMHDNKYSKVASCIVLRQVKTLTSDHKTINETLTECYAFLFQSKEYAHRFALALAEAFNTQKQSMRPSRQNHDNRREGRSPQRRSRHRHSHHRDRSNENYLKDSQV